jgi:hypothetical protein
MWRIPAALAAAVDLVAAEIEADPMLRAEVGTKAGKVTRAGVLRLLVSRGVQSVRGTLRENSRAAAAEAAATLAPATTTTKASKAPAGKGGRR